MSEKLPLAPRPGPGLRVRLRMEFVQALITGGEFEGWTEETMVGAADALIDACYRLSYTATTRPVR